LISNDDLGAVYHERRIEIAGGKIFEEEIENGWDSFGDAVDTVG